MQKVIKCSAIAALMASFSLFSVDLGNFKYVSKEKQNFGTKNSSRRSFKDIMISSRLSVNCSEKTKAAILGIVIIGSVYFGYRLIKAVDDRHSRNLSNIDKAIVDASAIHQSYITRNQNR